MKAKSLLAIFLMLAFGSSVQAQARSQQYIARVGQDTVATAGATETMVAENIQPPSSGEPPFPTRSYKEAPALSNPKSIVLGGGKIIVTVAATRKFKDGPSLNFGFRTGQWIPLTMVISADQDVIINVESLTYKLLSNKGSAFEMVKPPAVTTTSLNGKKVIILQLLVRSWVMEDALTFTAQFHYALRYLPDGKTPAWQQGYSPVYVVTTSRTATESSKQLVDGDMSAKLVSRPWWASALTYGGFLLLAIVPLWLLRRLRQWQRPRRKLTPAEKAWMLIEAVLTRAQGQALTARQLAEIAAALREYLAITSIPTSIAQSALVQFFKDQENGSQLVASSLAVLTTLDRSIYGGEELSPSAEKELIETITLIIASGRPGTESRDSRKEQKEG